MPVRIPPLVAGALLVTFTAFVPVPVFNVVTAPE